ncbi:hypothetical protein H312_01571 [Anncaliia algerae PRA339]|uniref:Uncharacterized protein n=1 Tax=Anncaliia algerae PRA339 TaxID=1288291 RepID=A0A059F210_9MICR|nr:hypothetical protein H312_01571 [Anncaliia algerae PRA339]
MLDQINLLEIRGIFYNGVDANILSEFKYYHIFDLLINKTQKIRDRYNKIYPFLTGIRKKITEWKNKKLENPFEELSLSK